MSPEGRLVGEDSVRAIIPDFCLRGLGRWRECRLTFGGPGPEIAPSRADLLIRAEYGYRYDRPYVVEIRMGGVSELSLPRNLVMATFFCLAVEDIRNWQREGVCYRVWDAEEEGMSCYCHSFRFSRVLSAEPCEWAEVLWEES